MIILNKAFSLTISFRRQKLKLLHSFRLPVLVSCPFHVLVNVIKIGRDVTS